MSNKVNFVIPQPDSPLKIVAYAASYQDGGSYGQAGIRHEVTYQNVSEKRIVAVQIGLISFDIWNEFLNRTGGISMTGLKPGKSEEGVWMATAYSDFAFHTGVCYVSKARFEEGEIWSADLDKIAEELRKIEKDFDVSRLKKKESGEK